MESRYREFDVKEHWDAIYQKSETSCLGWYEEAPGPSLQLIRESGISRDARILHVGAGATTLIDILLQEGYENQIATDISRQALQSLQRRLGKKASQKVEWLVDDLTDPSFLPEISPVSLWHDRAVLHFFTGEAERESYFALLRRLLLPGGWAILAAFHLDGAKKCSGLLVRNYDEGMLAEELGPGFRLVRAFPYRYMMPSGAERPYIYTLFQRQT
ncbi:MAG: class I SAM-dependent methyltransferase [Phaeodactylibacter sp.]|nr:class I SAM-dependent methyltransferase [Phaeodactylibacter sp.]